MEIPNKIYIERSTANILSHQDDTLASIWSKPSSHNDLEQTIEYTNLSEKWHDANVDTPLLNKLSPDNPVIIYSKALHGNGIVCLNHTAFSMAFNFAILRDNSVIWAWLKDLLP